jgi:hypothetical protein
MCIEEGINIKWSQLSSSLDGRKEKAKKGREQKGNKSGNDTEMWGTISWLIALNLQNLVISRSL